LEGVDFMRYKNTDAAAIKEERDLVEVVRCGNCKHNYGVANSCDFNPQDIVCCYWESDGLDEYDFCSRGVKKEAEEIVHCRDCKFLMFSDCYGECSKAYKGIVRPNDFCGMGERREK
jgi:hypothetical protein